MPEQKLIVFIGSTREDLTEHRAAVRAAVTELGLFPEGMETWPVEDLTAVELCREKVKKADIYIGIYAYRYGWQPPGFDNKSITELEYDWAGERGIPRLCFVVDDNHPWAETKKDYKTKPELDAFKARVKERIVGFYGDPADLKSKVAVALAKVIPNISTRRFVCDRVPKPALFAGRVKELAELKKALEGDQAVAITAVRGVGGIGKTTLAQQVAHELGDKFGLKLWAALGQNFEESRVGDVLRDWAGEKYPLDWPLDRIILETKNALTEASGECGNSALVVIDDVWKESVGSARKLLKAVPDGARILITTRTEAVAAQMDARTQRLQHMPPNEGADLMLKHLENTDAAKYREKLEALSEVLGGHPLALKLAARQLRLNFTPRDLGEMIATMKKGLAAGEAFKNLELDGSDEKEDSVSVTLQQTLDRLGGDGAEKRALRQKQFRALGALMPDVPFRVVYVAAVWGEEDRKGLRELVGEGLLEQSETVNEDERYIQHQLLRAYARGLARQAGELDETLGRYADAVIENTKLLPHYGGALERDNARNKLEADLPRVIAIAEELMGIYQHKLSDDKWQIWMGGIGSALLSYSINQFEPLWLEWMNRELSVGLTLNDLRRQAFCLVQFGDAHSWDPWSIWSRLDYYEKALSVYKKLGDLNSEASLCYKLGTDYDFVGDTRQGIEYLSRCVELEEQLGSPHLEITRRELKRMQRN